MSFGVFLLPLLPRRPAALLPLSAEELLAEVLLPLEQQAPANPPDERTLAPPVWASSSCDWAPSPPLSRGWLPLIANGQQLHSSPTTTITNVWVEPLSLSPSPLTVEYTHDHTSCHTYSPTQTPPPPL